MIEVRVPGKWVLAGEHAVLRGGSAVVFPNPQFSLLLSYRPSAEPLQISAAHPASVRTVVNRLAEIAIPGAPSGKLPTTDSLSGILTIESTIPEGAGLGSSAALCVAVTKTFGPFLKVAEKDFFATARELENTFHGQSSGMDIAAVMAEGPIRFSMAKGARPIVLHPSFKLRPLQTEFIDTGLRAKTADCIAQVNQGRREDSRIQELDVQMALAAEHAAHGLETGDAAAVAAAMIQAQTCFDGWGLTPAPIAAQIQALRKSGAQAAKLTGSGGGGFLVALR